jgi:glycosyltransferase involved in cell wall biosynthesis
MALAHGEAGHEAEIASLDKAGDSVGNLPFPTHLLGPGRGNYGKSDRLIAWLLANHRRFDGVIVHGLWQYQGYACRAALRGTRTPYFVYPHGMLDPWFKRQFPLKHLKKWLYWPWGEYRVLRDAAAVLFTCEEEKLLAEKSFWLYRAHAVVTGLGTRAPAVDLATEAANFLVDYPELSGKRIVLFMGRIHPKKGCDLLLRGFAEAFGQLAEWSLLMVGPDQVGWQKQLEGLAQELGIAERVCWAGPRMGDNKWGVLAAAEVFALTSHQENFGIAVAEALACGKPVLISDKVNIWREIEQEKAGMVAADTVEGTVAMLRAWAAVSTSDRAGYGERARVCFEKHFDIRACAEAVLRTVQEAAKKL